MAFRPGGTCRDVARTRVFSRRLSRGTSAAKEAAEKVLATGRNSRFLGAEAPRNDKIKDRHRGNGHPSSPATPPDMRGRIRRFGGLSCVPANKRGSPSESK